MCSGVVIISRRLSGWGSCSREGGRCERTRLAVRRKLFAWWCEYGIRWQRSSIGRSRNKSRTDESILQVGEEGFDAEGVYSNVNDVSPWFARTLKPTVADHDLVANRPINACGHCSSQRHHTVTRSISHPLDGQLAQRRIRLDGRAKSESYTIAG